MMTIAFYDTHNKPPPTQELFMMGHNSAEYIRIYKINGQHVFLCEGNPQGYVHFRYRLYKLSQDTDKVAFRHPFTPDAFI